jgi:riboflavin kinase / FMN adenylyltransferase
MNYIITGTVIRGDGYGRKIGFPTVNLEIEEAKKKELPGRGVYAGKATLEGVEYRAGIVLDPKDKVEAHLIEYEGDAYGKKVVLNLEKFIREYRNFDTEAELINQITEDIQKC